MTDARPALVISDLHLGRSGMVEHASEIKPLVDSASTLIVNGDAAELHVPEFAERARAELEALRDLCLAADTRLVLLAGNHDPSIVARRHLELASGQVMVTHGDGVDPALAPWSQAASIIRRRFQEVQEGQRPDRRDSLEGVFEACRLAAIAEFDSSEGVHPPTRPLDFFTAPRRIAKILRFWMVHPSRMDRFAARFVPTAHVIVFGHSHRAAVVKRGTRTLINTGCFGTPGPALAVEFSEDGLAVRRLSRRRSVWRSDLTCVHRIPDLRIDEDSNRLDDCVWSGDAA